MDATEQFAAFALMGLLANGSHHPKTVVDRAWELGRDMELKAMDHRRAMRAASQVEWSSQHRQQPTGYPAEPSARELNGGGK